MKNILTILFIVLGYNCIAQLKIEEKAVQYLIYEKEINTKDSLRFLTQKMFMVQKVAEIDTCVNLVLYKVKRLAVHSKSFFFLLKPNNEIIFLNNKSIAHLVSSVNNYILDNPCALDDKKKIKMYEYLIYANKYLKHKR